MDWSRAHDPPARRSDPPAPLHIRTLWMLTRPPRKPLTARICQVETGLELRIHVGIDERNLIDSLLSRTGEGPLESRAAKLRAMLEEQGWRVMMFLEEVR